MTQASDDTATLLVIGTGLVGTSVALGARAQGWRVWVHDADPDVARHAAAKGAGEVGLPTSDPDLVVLAVPPAVIPAVAAEYLKRYLTSTFTDVGSVKSHIVDETVALGADVSRLVPGHPMAGGEVPGPDAARADLFADRVWVLTPDARADTARVDQVAAFAAAQGAVVTRWDAAAHDRAVALTSHAPQLLSTLLAARLADRDPADVQLSGQGLRDMTRIAGSDPGLWTQILLANALPVLDVLEAIRADLDTVVTALRNVAAGSASATREAEQVLRDAMTRGNSGHARIPGKHGLSPAEAFSTVLVSVTDRPGELARLFALAGGAQVNLEDVRIDHVLGRPTGLVELTVTRDRETVLAEALAADGWTVRW
ncbi:MAG: prephenate dehydrogenase [Candidatus Nanopelagicales bacterium]